MKRTEAFASSYLNQDDLPQPHTATIKMVGKEMVNTDDNGQREKPVIYFNNGSKPLILNMVNWDTIEAAYGPDSDTWVGKPIELYVDPNVMYGARRLGGIRIRIPTADSAPIPFEKVIALAGEVGISREQIIDQLKKNGRTGYNAVRDSALVRELITSHVHPVTAPADDVAF